jgi:hypothetical protein
MQSDHAKIFYLLQIFQIEWLKISKGLLTPAIGLVAIYIAWQQWNTNRNKRKLDLFEKGSLSSNLPVRS